MPKCVTPKHDRACFFSLTHSPRPLRVPPGSSSTTTTSNVIFFRSPTPRSAVFSERTPHTLAHVHSASEHSSSMFTNLSIANRAAAFGTYLIRVRKQDPPLSRSFLFLGCVGLLDVPPSIPSYSTSNLLTKFPVTLATNFGRSAPNET